MEQSNERGVNRVDLVAAAIMFSVCTAFVVTAFSYGIGTPARMGPGFFPFTFGIAGMGLSLVIVVRSFLVPGALHDVLQERPVIFITAGIVAFGLLIETAGLGPALFASIVISSFADTDARLKGTLLLAIGLTASIWVVFAYLLGLPLPFVKGLD